MIKSAEWFSVYNLQKLPVSLSFTPCHTRTSFRTRKLPPPDPSRSRNTRGCECCEMQGRIIPRIFSLPAGPSLNPVTPTAISSRESNRVSLKADMFFPSERRKDRTFPGLFFRASPTSIIIDCHSVAFAVLSRCRMASDDDGVLGERTSVDARACLSNFSIKK